MDILRIMLKRVRLGKWGDKGSEVFSELGEEEIVVKLKTKL